MEYFVNQKGFRVKFGLLLAVITLFVISYFGLRIRFWFPYPVDMIQSIQFGVYVAIIGTLTLIAGKVVEHMTKVEKEIKPQGVSSSV